MFLTQAFRAAKSWLRTRRERNLPTEEALRERETEQADYIRKNAAAAAGPTLIK